MMGQSWAQILEYGVTVVVLVDQFQADVDGSCEGQGRALRAGASQRVPGGGG